METIISKINKYVEIALGIIMSSVVILTSVEVFLRYIFGKSLLWSNELNRFLFIWLVFLGASVGCYNGSHLCMDVFLTKIRGKNRRILNTIISLSTLIIIFIMIVYGFYITKKTMIQIYPVLKIPMGYAYLSIPVSSCLMFIYTIFNSIKNIRAGRK